VEAIFDEEMQGCVKRASHCLTVESKERKLFELQLRLFIGKDRKQSKKNKQKQRRLSPVFLRLWWKNYRFVSVVFSTTFEDF
jgi:hypothetical protein